MLDFTTATSRLKTFYGYNLNPWQRHLLNEMMGPDPFMYRVHDRQVGATYTAEARMILSLWEGQKVLYLAQLRDIVRSTMERMKQHLYTSDYYNNVVQQELSAYSIYRANGKERIAHKNGGELRFRSLHGAKSGRGMAADLVVIDAPMVKREILEDILPVTVAFNGKVIWLRRVDLQQEFPNPYF